MARVEAEVVAGPFAPIVAADGTIITVDLPAQPFGVYVMSFSFHHGVQPNSRTLFVHSFTGMGAVWERINAGSINAASLVDYWNMQYATIGPLRAGPVVVEVHESLGFPTFIPDAGPATAQSITYALHRIKNAPKTTVADMVQQTQFAGWSSVGSPVTVPLSLPIGDPRNLILATTVGSGNSPLPRWPFEQLWLQVPASASAGGFRANGVRDSTWDGGGSVNGVTFTEFGYARKPWLRQKQRDDV